MLFFILLYKAYNAYVTATSIPGYVNGILNLERQSFLYRSNNTFVTELWKSEANRNTTSFSLKLISDIKQYKT
jgi:hypothetical protein